MDFLFSFGSSKATKTDFPLDMPAHADTHVMTPRDSNWKCAKLAGPIGLPD